MNNTINAVGQRPTAYDFVKEKDILDISDTYTDIARLDVPYREVGTYEFKMAMLYKLNTAQKSIYFRYRFNGSDWNEIITEPKDKTDQVTADYFYPVRWNGGKLLVEFQIRKEDATATLDVLFFDAVFERKG